MKRLLIFLSAIFLVACGTSVVDDTEQDGDTQPVITTTNEEIEVEESNNEESEETEQEQKVIPTERTVETQRNYPWQYFTEDYIAELQMVGNTVYLLSDAEALEEHIIQTASREPEDEVMVENKRVTSEAFSENIDLFLNDVEEYIKNDKYIERLREIQQALLNYDYESVIKLTKEAKEIRESE